MKQQMMMMTMSTNNINNPPQYPTDPIKKYMGQGGGRGRGGRGHGNQKYSNWKKYGKKQPKPQFPAQGVQRFKKAQPSPQLYNPQQQPGKQH